MKAFALGASRFGFKCFFMPVVILDYGAIVEPFEVSGFLSHKGRIIHVDELTWTKICFCLFIRF